MTRSSTLAPQPVVPYSLLSEYDVFLLCEGRDVRLYEKLGSHVVLHDGVAGTHFALWAPNAAEVSVVGDFNGWNRGQHRLHVRPDHTGIWEGFIPGVGAGAIYKHHIVSNQHGRMGGPFYGVTGGPGQLVSAAQSTTKEIIHMTTLSQSTKRKLSLLQVAAELDNVSKACTIMGYHRDLNPPRFRRHLVTVDDTGLEEAGPELKRRKQYNETFKTEAVPQGARTGQTDRTGGPGTRDFRQSAVPLARLRRECEWNCQPPSATPGPSAGAGRSGPARSLSPACGGGRQPRVRAQARRLRTTDRCTATRRGCSRSRNTRRLRRSAYRRSGAPRYRPRRVGWCCRTRPCCRG